MTAPPFVVPSAARAGRADRQIGVAVGVEVAARERIAEAVAFERIERQAVAVARDDVPRADADAARRAVFDHHGAGLEPIRFRPPR